MPGMNEVFLMFDHVVHPRLIATQVRSEMSGVALSGQYLMRHTHIAFLTNHAGRNVGNGANFV